jgi:RNA polymerase sigma-70 factor (ECF subfamily)
MHSAREIQEKLDVAISNLSPQCRQAFELSRYEDLSYREISERMAISVKTVEKHIGKALKILKLQFKEHNIGQNTSKSRSDPSKHIYTALQTDE